MTIYVYIYNYAHVCTHTHTFVLSILFLWNPNKYTTHEGDLMGPCCPSW